MRYLSNRSITLVPASYSMGPTPTLPAKAAMRAERLARPTLPAQAAIRKPESCAHRQNQQAILRRWESVRIATLRQTGPS